jgi:regulator of protease activity HflC (stomatin/prohibitin superfamily)
VEYKFNKQAGALNEIAPAPAKRRAMPSPAFSNVGPLQQQAQLPADSYASAHDTGAFPVANLAAGAPPIHAQSLATRQPLPAPAARGNGLDPQSQRRDFGMFFYTVREGERVRVIHKDGRVDVVKGPRRLWRWGKTIEPMLRHVAHPGEFLIVRFRDGRQEHHEGPANLWFDPREHLAVQKEDALQISAKEAVVVYSRDGKSGEVTRRFVHGPASFVPAPGEWLHTFSWHGSRGGEDGYTKVPNALVFQKLWFLPDQMYHDVQDVRTADDAVITVRLMIFFELVDLPRMLETTHDPIGDFVNAATSDVVEFTGKHDFESFKRRTEQLNDLASYRQLTARAEQCGYRIDKVVYRGYGAPENLQRMHDEAIESRTRLQLERATQQQAQDLEDFTQERQLARAARLRTEQEASVAHEIAQAERQREANLRAQKAQQEFSREQARLEAEQQAAIARRQDEQRLAWLASLQKMNVDLTAYLTQARADRVIEVRGQDDLHLHLDGDDVPRR